ncbi:MAG: 16S rRNA (cytosine(967)-C(5))-methyltransferase RsmB [Proteobacteria bacterium]|nr:MAG: 16S rRNA (cytosine(967)-C(5))-methyltransferase RsmB [Pseudomonadota bacterium]
MNQSSLSIAREVAFDAFTAVMENKRKPEQVLNEMYALHGQKISRLDKAFIKEILYGSFRWYSKIYWILQNTSKRNLDDSSPEIRAALILGTYQIYYMDRVPDRAAVNESVEYVRKKGQAKACTFVNGILRQIGRRAEYFPKPDKKTKAKEYLALQFAHPLWLVDRWLKRFRFERMELMLAANNQPPSFSIRINSLKSSLAESADLQETLLREEKITSERRPLRSSLRLMKSPQLAESKLFQDGYFTVQDEASQLIGYLVAPEADQKIADACAGPGGKLSHIYELGLEKITLYAVEKDHGQYLRAQETLDRLGLKKLNWVHEDFMAWNSEEKLDKILLDAPCSGLGVLRRHPEGKWSKNVQLVDSMATQQWAMIQHALKQLKVGGELIYSVCSFETEETESHLLRLKETMSDTIEVISPVSRLPDYYKKYVTHEQLFAVYAGNQDDMDGFGAFIVRLKKPIA